MYLCYKEYNIVNQHTQTAIALASVFWILTKSAKNSNPQILLNYLLYKIQTVL